MYLKKNDTVLLSAISYDLIQSFHIPPQASKAMNEGYVIKSFLSLSQYEQEAQKKMLIFLAKFHFATEKQLQRYMLVRGYTDFDFEKNIPEMILKRSLNYFNIATNELAEEPADAERIYCLDMGSRYILSHYYREDFIFWKAVDTAKSIELVLKNLSTVEFFLAALESNTEYLRAFEPMLTAPIGSRDTKFSAYIELKPVKVSNSFVLESVRSADLPVYWRKKVSEQISPFILGGHWKKIIRRQPEFILLTENMDDALEASEIYYNYFLRNDFYVTTDLEIQKGFDEAQFWQYEEGSLALSGNPLAC